MSNTYAKFTAFIDSLALSLFFFGPPLVYFVRDGLGVAPNSMIFTIVFMVLPMFLVFPFRNLKQVYIPNRLTFSLALIYLGMSLFYLFFHHYYGLPFTKQVYEFAVICIMLYIYFLLSTISINDLEKHLLDMCIVLSFIGALGLLWHVYQNPAYVIGRRASIITTTDSGEENTGNPHIYSKGAYLGMVAAMVMLKYKNSTLKTVILYGCIIVFIVVIVLTQAMSTIMTTGIFLGLFFLINLKSIAKGTVKFVKKPIAWILIIGFLIQAGVFAKKYSNILNIGYKFIEQRVNKLALSFFPEQNKTFLKGPIDDDSANTRIHLLEVVQEKMVENFDDGNYLALLFGNGYKDLYVDVPIVETFNSLGLLGFLIFTLLLYQMTKSCFLEMRRPGSRTTEFIAYGFIYFLVMAFTNGLIIDYIRWGFFALVCRYIPLNIIPKKIESNKPKEEILVT